MALKVKRRGFIATIAALFGGAAAVSKAPALPAAPPGDDHLDIDTIDGAEQLSYSGVGGDCVIRGGSGTGAGYAGPIEIIAPTDAPPGRRGA